MKFSKRTVAAGLILVAGAVSLSLTHGQSTEIVVQPCQRFNSTFSVSPGLNTIGQAAGGGYLIARKSGIYSDDEPGLTPLLESLPQHVNVDAIHHRQNTTWLFSLDSHAVVGGQILQHNKMYETDGVNIWGYAPYNNACSSKFASLDAFVSGIDADVIFLISVSQLQFVPGLGIAHPGDVIYCDTNGTTLVWNRTSMRGVDNIDGLCDSDQSLTADFSAGLDMIWVPPFILQDARAYNSGSFLQQYDGTLSGLQRVNALSCEDGMGHGGGGYNYVCLEAVVVDDFEF